MYFLENDEIKFVILYTLWRYETPIPFEELNLILTWENQILDYFTLAEKFGELFSDEFIVKTVTENREKYALTPRGIEAVEFFNNRIPASIKRMIDTSIGTLKYDSLINPPTVSSEVVPVTSSGQFAVKNSIIDDGVTLLNMEMFVGDRSVAVNISKHFKENATEIYQAILRLSTPKKDEA